MRRVLLAAAVLVAAVAAATTLATGSGTSDLRAALLAMPLTRQLGGDTTRVIMSDDSFTFLASNAPAKRQRVFDFGNRVFNTKWAQYPSSTTSFDGLGPTFNRNSCSGCHVRDGRGRPPDKPGDPMESMLVRLSAPDGSPLPAYGDQLEDRAILAVKPEGRAIIDYQQIAGTYGDGTPYTLLDPHVHFVDTAFGSLDDALVSARVAPAVIGLGLLEAVPLSTLQALADPGFPAASTG